MGRNFKFKYNFLGSIFFPLIFLILTVLQYLSDWWVFKVSGSAEAKIREAMNFSDLRSILSYVPCYRTSGNSIYLFDNISPCHKGYIYGTPLLDFFSAIRVDDIPLFIVGSALTIFFCLALAVIASKALIGGRFNTYLILCSFLSPGIWLLLERTNLDILIFLMLLVSSQLFSKGYEISAILVIAFTALFKFYTLPVILVLIVVTNRKSTRVVGTLVAFLVFPKVFLDISSITNPGFPSTWYISFGLESIGLYINLFLEQINQAKFILSSLEVKILGYLTLILALILLSKFYKIESMNAIDFLKISSDFTELNFLRISFWIFGATFISCYLAGMSYDYRLTFLAAAGVSFIALAKYQKVKIIRLTWIFSVALWFSGSFLPSTSLLLSGLIQLIGDISIFILSTLFLLVIIEVIKSTEYAKKIFKMF